LRSRNCRWLAEQAGLRAHGHVKADQSGASDEPDSAAWLRTLL
jgi:hypothetical protein